METNKNILLLDKIDKTVANIIYAITIVLMLASTLIICVQVVGRYCFGVSSEIMEELCRYLIVAAAFYVTAPMITEGGHIILDVFVARIKSQKVLLFLEGILTPVITAAVSLSFISFGFELVIKTGAIRTTSLLFPQAFPYSLLPTGMIFVLFFSAIKLIKGVYAFAACRAAKEEGE